MVNYAQHDMNNNLLESTVEFTLRVSVWNKEVFGNIFKRKRLLLARIEVIQRAQTTNFSHNLQALEKDLINQYNVTIFSRGNALVSKISF